MAEKTGRAVINAINHIQNYIEDNLTGNITLLELGKEVNYSVWHLERIFKEAVGMTIFEYIRKLRLTEAAKTLRDNNVKIIDTALDFMFDSHEGFTRAFSKEFGISPYKYKTNPVPVPYFIAYKVISADKPSESETEEQLMKTRTIFTQVVERPARKAIILRGKKAENYYGYCNEVGCDVWGVLTSVKEALFEPSGYWLPDSMISKGTSRYVQGVEVPENYSGKVPEGYEIIELPPCMLMVFNGELYKEEDYEKEIGYVMDAIEKFNPESYGYKWDESLPRFQLAPRGDRGYIEAKPVKKIS